MSICHAPFASTLVAVFREYPIAISAREYLTSHGLCPERAQVKAHGVRNNRAAGRALQRLARGPELLGLFTLFATPAPLELECDENALDGASLVTVDVSSANDLAHAQRLLKRFQPIKLAVVSHGRIHAPRVTCGTWRRGPW